MWFQTILFFFFFPNREKSIWGWEKVNLDVKSCLINIFSVFYLPCFNNYWAVKPLWTLNDSWAAARVPGVLCGKWTSLADQGPGSLTLQSRQISFFLFFILYCHSEMVAILYLCFLRYILQGLIFLFILPLLEVTKIKNFKNPFLKRIIFDMFHLSKYFLRLHQTASILGRLR